MEKEVTLQNGRRYLVIDTGLPYVDGEYPIGGLVIKIWHKNQWVFLDHTADHATLNELFKSAE